MPKKFNSEKYAMALLWPQKSGSCDEAVCRNSATFVNNVAQIL